MVSSPDVALPGAQANAAEGTRAETPAQAIAVATDLSALELRRIRRILLLIFLLATLTATYFARDVLLPIVLAILVWLTLLPLVRAGQRLGVPRGVTAVGSILAIAGGLFLAGYFMSGPVRELVESAPEVAQEVQDRLGGLIERVRDISRRAEEVTGGAVADAVAEAAPAAPDGAATAVTAGDAEGALVDLDGDGEPTTRVIAVEVGGEGATGGVVGYVLSSAASAGGAVAAALLLALFLLASGDFYHRRIVEAAPRLRDKKKALTIIRDVERQISRYLASITLINAGLGAAVTVALWLLGMPTPVVWGALAFLLNFIPFVGNVANVILVAAVSLVTFDTLWGAALPALALVVLMLLESNVVTPIVVGRRLELNLVSQLIVVAFWTWLWGLAGAILAVPFLVVVKAVADNVESLQTLSSFLSAEPETKEDEAPQKATTGPALDTAPLRTQAEARAASPPGEAPGAGETLAEAARERPAPAA